MVAFLVDLLVYVALWVFLFFNLHLGDYLSWLLASSYLLVKDGLVHGQSLGKLIVRQKVVHVPTKEPITLIDSIKRNVILILPNVFRFIPFWGSFLLLVIYGYEAYLLYTHPDGRRWGDQFAQTSVIQA
jgi:uncharacterized RDD family membrane protein YckC